MSKKATETQDDEIFILAQAQKATKKGKKGTIPEISPAPDSGVDVDLIYRLKQELVTKEAELEVEAQKVRDLTAELYREQNNTGSFSKSFNLEGSSTPGIRVTYKDKFKAIPIEKLEFIRQTLKTKFASFFRIKRTITVTNPDNPQVVKTLRKLLGNDLFASVFTVTVQIVPQDDMDRKQFSLPSPVRNLLEQEKASVAKR